MRRQLAALVLTSGIYGFAIGSVHSLRFGLHNLLKFPLLIFVTIALGAVAYFLFATLVGLRLRFVEVQGIALRLFGDGALLLAALAPASYFLARTIVKPDRTGLGEYPLFLGLNVVFVAACGFLALARQVQRLGRGREVPLGRRCITAAGWLALSLMVGGQGAWYLRPFFGVASISGPGTRFFLGAAPDYRGRTNFYEAVHDLVKPAPLTGDFYLRGRGY